MTRTPKKSTPPPARKHPAKPNPVQPAASVRRRPAPVAPLLVTIIGRGHSGTRAMSHTLTASGVFMGEPLNGSGDLLPPGDMYDACRIMARHVRHLGGLRWDFSALHTMPIDPEFKRLVRRYLKTVLKSPAPARGWKIPETTLVYPWIVRLFPDIHYIYWIRDPRDCILGAHLTDDLASFGVPYEATPDERLRRAISWKYQVDIVKATPRPRHFLTVRFEDLVLHQAATLRRIGKFLGLPLARIPVRPESIGRWRTDEGRHMFPFFTDDLAAHGYAQSLPTEKRASRGQVLKRVATSPSRATGQNGPGACRKPA